MYFLDDPACLEKIQQAEPELVKYFNQEPNGNYKADICRLAALYLGGGYYFDIDLEVVNIVNLEPEITFSTASSGNDQFFQAWLACAPRHPVIAKGLQFTLEYYQGKRELHGLMGTSVLKDAFDAVSEEERGDVYLLQEADKGDQLYPDLPGWVPRREATGDCFFILHDANAHVIYFYARIVGVHICFHPIPTKLWFSHEHNVLETKEPIVAYNNVQNTYQRYRKAWDQFNDREVEFHFLDDSACREMIVHAEVFSVMDRDGSGDIDRPELAQVMVMLGMDPNDNTFNSLEVNGDGKIDLQHQEEFDRFTGWYANRKEADTLIRNHLQVSLLPFFATEQHADFKADICRAAALYLHGGYYFDIDLEVASAPYLVSSPIRFAAVQANGNEFVRGFLACAPKHKVLKKWMETLASNYQAAAQTENSMGPADALQQAFHAVPAADKGEVYLLQEVLDGHMGSPQLVFDEQSSQWQVRK